MRTGIRLALVFAVLPIVALAQTVSPPPQPLHLVGDHWTPYDPPTEFPEGANVHTIVKGDTLWDLARHYLGDPYLWPQLWERNPYIRDSHWIYPGDPLVIDITVQEAPLPVEEEEVQEEEALPSVMPTSEEETFGEAVPLGSSSDVYCFVELADDPTLFPFRIVSAEQIEYQSTFTEGDIVYIDGGTAEGVAPGDKFFILSDRGPLNHPVSKTSMGNIYKQLGQLTVLCAQEHSSICEITSSCDSIPIGALLRPFRPIPVPLAVRTPKTQRCDPPSGNVTGYVVYQQEGILDAGTEHLILLDLGEADGVYPGQFVTIFKENTVPGMPRVVMGEAGILRVGEHYATARILDTWGAVHVLDRVEIK